jgi:hypothetical protein
VFSRGEARWLYALGSDVRHYLYPVHPSEALLSTPSLAAALYLLLMRFMARQYADVFRMVESCVTDMKLTSEEASLYKWLGSLKADHHPDAVACRLKISAVSAQLFVLSHVIRGATL